MIVNYICVLVLSLTILRVAAKLSLLGPEANLLKDHMSKTDSNVFPYMAAVLNKQTYLSAGALLDHKWVLTAASAVFGIAESTHFIKVRLGSINYKKGGVLVPVKRVEVHPFFDASKPLFDLALIELAEIVRMTPKVYPIRMQTTMRELTATHLIVTGWTPSLKEQKKPISLHTIKQQRLLSISLLHPAESDLCAAELVSLDIISTDHLLCLNSDLQTDPCRRDIGAPVVLNGVLWGIVSAWRPHNCSVQPGSSFVGLIALPDVTAWINATTHFRKWNSLKDDLDWGLNAPPTEEDSEDNER